MNFPRKQIKANARGALSAHYWPIVGYPLLMGLLLSVVIAITSSGSVDYMKSMSSYSYIYSAGSLTPESIGKVAISDIITFLLAIFVYNVIAVGEAYFYYKFYSGSEGNFGTFFDGFRDGKYWHVVGGMFLMTLFVFLWTMLFALPGAFLFGIGIATLLTSLSSGFGLVILGSVLYLAGIIVATIKAYQYAMVPYLLIDKPELTVSECFAMTKKMTKGNKLKLLVLDLSISGWWILSILILIIFLVLAANSESIGFMLFCLFVLFVLAIVGIFYVTPYQSLADAGAYDYFTRVHMSNAVSETPVFQSASYEANYTENVVEEVGTQEEAKVEENNDDIFDE
jgi:uncharacterized membrane protein